MTDMYQVHMAGLLHMDHRAPDGVSEHEYKTKLGKRFMSRDYYAILPWIYPDLRQFWSYFTANLTTPAVGVGWHAVNTDGTMTLEYITENKEGLLRLVNASLRFEGGRTQDPDIYVSVAQQQPKEYKGRVLMVWQTYKRFEGPRVGSSDKWIKEEAERLAEHVDDILGYGPHGQPGGGET